MAEPKKRILIAEDNEVNRKLVSLLLKRFGFELEAAEDGKEAADILRSGTHFDCLLLDLKMPELDGFAVTRIVRGELKSNMPIIALTADTSEEEKNKCLAAGMNDFLSKPFEPQRLYEKIANLLGIEDHSVKERGEKDEDQPGALNLTYLNEITQGDKQQQVQLADVFLVNTPQMLIELGDLFDSGEYDEMRKMAHKIRSGASVMLTSGPLRLLYQIEYTAPGSEKEERLGEKIRLFTHICHEALDELRIWKEKL
jgi:CheY-like chemotaxis protein